MGPLEREAARRRGQRKLDAMRRRTGQLRRRVVAIAIVAFAMLWAAVFVQMAVGNDPALGTGAPAKKKAALEPERRRLQALAPPPPPSEAEEEGGPAPEEPGVSETARVEAERERAEVERAEFERAEIERAEIERAEIEARELEELGAVTTGQS